MKRKYEKFRRAGGQIVTISPDSTEELAEYLAKSSIPFLMLGDTERAVIKEYGIYNPAEHDGTAVPSVFIIDGSRTVRFAHIEGTVLRVRNKTLLKELASL